MRSIKFGELGQKQPAQERLVRAERVARASGQITAVAVTTLPSAIQKEGGGTHAVPPPIQADRAKTA